MVCSHFQLRRLLAREEDPARWDAEQVERAVALRVDALGLARHLHSERYWGFQRSAERSLRVADLAYALEQMNERVGRFVLDPLARLSRRPGGEPPRLEVAVGAVIAADAAFSTAALGVREPGGLARFESAALRRRLAEDALHASVLAGDRRDRW